MKKNILLVQTFLILPLMSSSLIFSMENGINPEQTYAIVTQRSTHLPQALKRSGSTKKRKSKKQAPAPTQPDPQSMSIPETTVPQSYFTEDDKTNAQTDLQEAQKRITETSGLNDLLQIIRSINGKGLNTIATTSSLQMSPKNIKIPVSEILADSILSPSERSELGIGQLIWNSWKTNRAVAIDLLTNKTFEPNNAAHTEYFNKALEECAKHKDLVSLENIMNACQAEEYKFIQSAINHTAPAFNFLCDTYEEQVNNANKDLISCNEQCAIQLNAESAHFKANFVQLLTQYEKTVAAIGMHFEKQTENEKNKVETLQSLINTVSRLNSKVPTYEKRLLSTCQFNIPTNSVKAIEEDTYKNVRHLLTHANMPQAKTNILQIDNK